MNSWIDIVNNNNDIHKHLTESFLIKHIDFSNSNNLNWMNIFNSKIVLSNEFIIKFLDYIEWEYFTRILDESMLERYSRNIVNWNVQLYGPARTFEFMTKFQKKFDWQFINTYPPSWFKDTHYFVFRNYVQQPVESRSTIFLIELPMSSITKTPDDWDWHF